MDTIYRQLARKINGMGMGLPETDEGYELIYLQELYTEEEAQFALDMPMGLHTAEEFAADMHRDVEEIRTMLEKMAADSLVIRVHEGETVKYYLLPIIHGFLEFNIDKFNDAIAKSFGAHYTRGMGARFFGSKAPLFRILPIRKEVVDKNECMIYDDVHAIIDKNEKFALTKCFCRLSANWGRGTTCKYTPDYDETCMLMGTFAEFFLENKMAVEITKEQAHEHMNQSDAMDTVVEVINTRDVEVMCSCCKCCCGVIKALIMFGGESAGFATNYRVKYNKSTCIGCKKCTERCQVAACSVDRKGRLKVNPDKCIGCGLCVTTCPTQSLKLERKSTVYIPPTDTAMDLYDYVRASRRKAGEI